MPKVELQKYGAPLYAIEWFDEFGYMCGGGNNGIENKIILVQRQGDKLSEELSKFTLGEDVPYRMKIHPSGKALVVSLAVGGFTIVRVEKSEEEALPVLSWPLPAVKSAAEKCSFVGVVKCISCSSDGTALAMGTEDGKVHVFAWPSLKKQGEFDVSKDRRKGVRNVDFSPAHNNGILIAVDESGSCSLWNLEDGRHMCNLEKPSNLPRVSLFRVVSTVDDKGIALYGAANVKGIGHIVRWRQHEDGSIHLDGVSKRPVAPSPISGFEISHDGSKLAVVTPDAEQCLVDATSLRRTRLVKGAHLTFATAVTFTPDDSAIISVSADASATLTDISSNEFGSMYTVIMIVFLLSLIAMAFHLVRLHGMTHPDMMLQIVHNLPEWAQNILSSTS